MRVRLLMAGLEAAADSVTRDEIEYVCFAKVNAEQVETLQASAIGGNSTKQEQYQIKAPNGLVRVRRTNDSELELTAKAWYGDTRKECNTTTTQELFDLFAMAAGSGWNKQRIQLKIPDTVGMWAADHPNYPVTGDGSLFWEVDFFTADGKAYSPWVKIDLEVPNHEVALPKLLIETEQYFDVQYKARTPEQQQFCDRLYQTEWQYTPPELQGVDISAGTEAV